ncbi:MAG TPA: tripartite tricarboxylate transporter substrate binding protein [Burkholderiales bacterium]|jgi:tripartite-type tricarboxylate transporter receptor subunit TctC
MRSQTCSFSRRTLLLGLLAAGLAPQGAAFAQNGGAKVVRLVMPYAPGGASDSLGRAVAERMSALYGTKVIVDNKPGGGTTIGTLAALNAPADGQTMLVAASSFAIQPMLFQKPPYEVKDFAPLILMGRNPHVLIVNPNIPVANFTEFVAWAKKNRETAAYASFGIGSSNHLGFELLKKETGLSLIHVPYKGGGPATQDLLGGQVATMLADLPTVSALIKAGRVRALALGAAHRDSAVPEVPTFTEAGLAGFTSYSWYGLVVRAGTPPEAIKTLNTQVNGALADPGLKANMQGMGLELIGGTPEAFQHHLDTESKRFREAIQFAGVKPE